MAQTKYEYGRQAEYKIRDTLRAYDYSVIRAAASQGIFDIVGFHNKGRDTIAVQAKRGERPSPCEYKTAIDLPVAPGVIKVVLWYPPRLSLPRILYCNIDPVPEWFGLAGWQLGPLPRQSKLKM